MYIYMYMYFIYFIRVDICVCVGGGRYLCFFLFSFGSNVPHTHREENLNRLEQINK